MESTDLSELKHLLTEVGDGPSAGEIINQRFHPQTHVADYLALLNDKPLPEKTRSLILRVLYVAAKKWELADKKRELAEVLDGLADFVGSGWVHPATRTLTLLFLMRLDLQRAYQVVVDHLPQFWPLIAAEELYPTISGDPRDSGTPFEEAFLNHL